MKSDLECSLVHLVAHLGPNVSTYALAVYGGWTRRRKELHEALDAAVSDGALGVMEIGEHRYYTAVAGLNEIEGPMGRRKAQALLWPFLAALNNQRGYPRWSDEVLMQVTREAYFSGCTDEHGRITPIGLQYLEEEKYAPHLTLVKPRRAGRGGGRKFK